ncbi:MAG: UDP-N-acetylmuramate--L-alanine ligase [Anaerolineaceae bacterium]|nr:UDP-N-acetylmuramate--L-alanine ligase [Anaerolineaceae bacterium]
MTHYHFIGIGGTGLSAIARILLESGQTVSGSDRTLSPLAAGLQVSGATVMLGHRAVNIAGADVVIRSSAVSDDNPEVVAARGAGIPVLKRADFLKTLIKGKGCIAVAGTHGKTTTSAMIAWMLTALGEDPSYIVGGVMVNTGQNAHAGQGHAFVIEADEYDRMFLGLSPDIAVVTYMEHDHPDCFPTWEEYQKAFCKFARNIRLDGILIAYCDNLAAATLLEKTHQAGKNTCGYAIHTAADYQARKLERNDLGGFNFIPWQKSGAIELPPVSLQVAGEHNVLNALAAMIVAVEMGLDLKHAAQALGEYQGTARRFELRGEPHGITIIDDYAHHPTEILATLAAARSRYPSRRIWVVWQPHTYSRTRALFGEFATAFHDADKVIVTEVYAAREPQEAFSALQVVTAMQHPGATFLPTLGAVVDYLEAELRTGDVLLVLSAGDADQISTQLVQHLTHPEANA